MKRLDISYIKVMNSNMKIVITGATGLLGRHLDELLKSQGHELFLLSRKEKEGFIQTDYSYDSLKDIVADKDAIIHLAATRSGEGKFGLFINDVLITETLYTLAKENSIKNIVFASSISVYSDTDKLPWNEDLIPRPVSFYGISKFTNEMIGDYYNRKHGLYVKNLRFAHLFGPNEKNNYMINYFFRLAFCKQKIIIDTKSTSKREFLYVKDAAKAISIAILQKDISGTFNIGTDIRLTNKEVADSINKVFLNPIQAEIKNPLAQDSSKPSYMCNDKAREVLGINFDYNFEDALKEIYDLLEEEDNVPLLY